MRRILIMLAWIMVRCYVVHGQDVAGFPISQRDGLPSNTVYHIYQSKNGFLWIATENGLARYDGFNFYAYENPVVRSKAVSGLLEDGQGRIWLHNFFGEILYIENDTLRRLESWEHFYEEGFPTMTYFRDTLLISTAQHAHLYAIRTKVWTHLDSLFYDGHDQRSLQFGDHEVDAQGEVWMTYGDRHGYYIKSLRTGVSMQLPAAPEAFNLLASRMVRWRQSLYIFDAVHHRIYVKTGSAILEEVSAPFQNALTNTRQIINSGDSLLFLTGPEKVRRHTKNSQQQDILYGKNVSAALVDHEGGYWFGTLNEGIWYVPHLASHIFRKDKFRLFNKLARDSRDGRVFAGGDDGSITTFSTDGKVVNQFPTAGRKEVQSIFVDTVDNRLLVFTDALYVFDLRTYRLLQRQSYVSVKKMIRVGHQYVLATSGGLYALDTHTWQTEVLIPMQRTTTVVYDEREQILWVGAQKGLYQYDLPKRTYQLWQDGRGVSPGVASLLMYGDELVVGTLTSGIYMVRAGNLERKITQQDGLPSNRISSLVVHKDMLWGATERGVFAWSPAHAKVSVINHTKGLTASEVYDLVFLDDRLWVSHPEGLQVFLNVPARNTRTPSVHIRQATVDGHVLSSLRDVVLSPSSRQLTFYFEVSDNLKSRGQTRIFYRIKDKADDPWQYTTLALPVASYLALPPGRYALEVRAVNEDGISSDTLSVPIVVLAPFWKRAWFVALVFLAALMFLAMLLHWRFRRISRRNRLHFQQQHQAQQLRIAQLTSIRAQMNPHFIFNTLSAIQGKILNRHLEEASRGIQHFAQLMRRVLEMSSREMVTLQDEVHVLQEYLTIEKDRFDGALDYAIHVSPKLQGEYIRIPSLLTQPFVENALRHGLMHKTGSKHLTIDFDQHEDQLIITIDDNGIGRKAAEALRQARTPNHRSFAMEAYRKRIELLNGSRKRKIQCTITDKHNEYGLASGTRVVIALPLEDELD